MRYFITGWVSSRDDFYLFPGWLSSRCLVIYLWVSYMIWSKNRFAPGWFHPGVQHRNEIIPGRTHFCTKSCKRLTGKWPDTEMKVTPGGDKSHPGMSFISSRGDFHLGVWSFTCESVTWFGAKIGSPRNDFIPVFSTGMKSSRANTFLHQIM